MQKTYHFIAGLPRSGSTLLSAVLRQNPLFMAGMTSAVAPIIMNMLPIMGPTSEYGPLFNDDRRQSLLKGIFDIYYSDAKEAKVIFDTNRFWCGKIPLLVHLFPNCRVICCVREPGWIIDSFERLTRKYPLQISKIVGTSGARATIYGREDTLMDVKNGLIGMAWSHLKEAWYSEQASRLIIMSYEGFTRDPVSAIKKLYAEIKEPLFEHDFDHVEYSHDDYDEGIGLPGLHSVRPKVTYQNRTPVIPDDIFERYKDAMFWKETRIMPPQDSHDKALSVSTKGPTIIC